MMNHNAATQTDEQLADLKEACWHGLFSDGISTSFELNIALSIEAKLGVGGCGFAIAAESIRVR